VLLYDSPVSGNCYKVRLLLAHLGIPYERRTMDVVDRSNRPEVLGGLNPSLRVPTLVLDDGRALGESGAILWYFGECAEDPYERARVLQWLFFEQYDHEPTSPSHASGSATRAVQRRCPTGWRSGTATGIAHSRRWRRNSRAATGSSATG
jgi:glutathione S-transferase